MDGFVKTAMVIVLLSSISVLSFASNINKAKLYSTKIACIMCHQGKPMHSDKFTDKNLNNSNRQNHAKNN